MQDTYIHAPTHLCGGGPMSLPWVRLDSNIASHDKITALLSYKDGHKSFTLYVCALGWSGGHGTDGFIPHHVLPLIHGNPKLAQNLVAFHLWDEAVGGWKIHNYEQRQELAVVAEMKRAGKAAAGRKSQCVQRHGPACGCWMESA